MTTGLGEEVVSCDSTQPVSHQPLEGGETIHPGADHDNTEEHGALPTIQVISQEDSDPTASKGEEVRIVVENFEDSTTPPICLHGEGADYNATVEQKMLLPPEAMSKEDCSSIASNKEREQKLAKTEDTPPVSLKPVHVAEGIQPGADQDAKEELKLQGSHQGPSITQLSHCGSASRSRRSPTPDRRTSAA